MAETQKEERKEEKTMKTLWALVDFKDRLIALNPGSMEGCTDWKAVETSLSVDDPITDEHGAALYRLEGETVIYRSEGERATEWPEEARSNQAIEERVDVLEEDTATLAEAVDILLGVED